MNGPSIRYEDHLEEGTMNERTMLNLHKKRQTNPKKIHICLRPRRCPAPVSRSLDELYPSVVAIVVSSAGELPRSEKEELVSSTADGNGNRDVIVVGVMVTRNGNGAWIERTENSV